jgi:hypothetical protein
MAMTSWEERRRSLEERYAIDQEMAFKAAARRNRYLGEWAGRQLGYEGDQLEAYVRELIKTDLEEPGDMDVFRKLRADFDTANVAVSDEDIRVHMDRFTAKAMEELRSG